MTAAARTGPAGSAARIAGDHPVRHSGTGIRDIPRLAALTSPDGEVNARLPDQNPGTLVVDIPHPMITHHFRCPSTGHPL